VRWFANNFVPIFLDQADRENFAVETALVVSVSFFDILSFNPLVFQTLIFSGTQFYLHLEIFLE